ncbi:MAG: hypothetical protein M0R03_23725 [Novosphingobium sp.]|nr:hypothetical protein [Novosphingobium sp.]
MKKLFSILLVLLAAFTIPVLASDLGSGGIADPSEIFVSFTVLVVAIPFIVEAIKAWIKPEGSFLIQLISWGTGIAVTMFGWWLNLGFLEGIIWWNAIVIGFFVSLAANGGYDTGLFTWLLKSLGILKK